MSLDAKLADPSLEDLKNAISPEEIAYYSE
jgi:hypothetical protein